MSILHSRETQVLIDRIISDSEALPGGAPKGFDKFVRHYYHSVPYDDLGEREIADLLGSARAHWELGRRRKKDETKIRVYNPDAETHGWQSDSTVAEVVTEDRPFLVDSVSMLLNRLGLTIQLTIHPLFMVRRDANGRMQQAAGSADDEDGWGAESYLHVEFDRRFESDLFENISVQIKAVLRDIESATADWGAMRSKVVDAAANIESEQARKKEGDDSDEVRFCRWIEHGNFTFLGYCELKRKARGGLVEDALSMLGILRNRDDISAMIPVDGLAADAPLERGIKINKANSRSPIHRPTYMDMITIPNFADDGELLGFRVVLGLFTSAAYNDTVSSIPLLRLKAQYVVSQSSLPENSYDMRALLNIVHNYPRDNLFMISDKALFQDVAGIMELQERQRVRVFMQEDPYDRFYSAIVYLPRDRFSRELRIRIQDILMDSLQGVESQFAATFSESALTRINYTIHKQPGTGRKHTDKQILASIEAATQNWTDMLRKAMFKRFSEKKRIEFEQNYGDAFGLAYQEDFTARKAAADMERMSALTEENPTSVFLYKALMESEGTLRLKIYNLKHPVSPSDSLPVIENIGLRVVSARPYRIRPADGGAIWIQDFEMAHVDGMDIDPDEVREDFQVAFLKIWNGAVENDGFNRLILSARLSWREVSMLRAYAKYLKQTGSQYSESYIIETLNLHPHMVKRLVELFAMMFDPDIEEDVVKYTEHVNFVASRLEVVKSLDEDVILRSYMNLIMSTLRTNYYHRDASGEPLPYLSFKIDSERVMRMPDPRPKFEIFVYSPRVEAVHLRGGMVARGGLRWSDRREDFRTEVLGLVKAQMVKNAVIVPVGSKGGFVVKRLPSDREKLQREVIECYKTFIRGMLDITDNLVSGEVVHPASTRIHDGEDPYLVVAADKGTATFSDIANEISQEYGFWLGDAFASGGSAGYDHKGMGITARGGWESVKRHFRELGIDTQATDFTVVGIGDMGGDVFGNGMLLSEHIRLIGAFNHLHIFLDPNPDSAASFKERQRLFELPRSSWADYDEKLISDGGGVFERSAKSIELSAEVKEALDVSADSMTPVELISAMLKAPVDLLWNGGIGTYVKATSETHDDAADRANDSLRVNGKQLRCRVFGEGGNLGATQLGRIEYSLAGGRCYTDFIDNSAGVDCSDHEVNIKILLNEVVSEGDMTVKQRNALLEKMTDTVGDYVLADNYEQTQAISVASAQSLALLGEHRRFIRELERAGELNRQLEFLPENEEMEERELAGQGLASPELAVLLAYSKLTLYQHLLNSSFPKDPYLRGELMRYFPDVLAKKYSDVMFRHRLIEEIISTYATNSMVNRVGPSFAFRLHQLTGAGYPDIARAYTAARDIFEMQAVWDGIKALDNKVSAQLQTQMLIYAGGLIERATMWLLRHRKLPLNIEQVVTFFKDGIDELTANLAKTLPKHDVAPMKRQTDGMIKKDVPKPLATKVAGFIPMSTSLDIVEIARMTDKPVLFVASAYFEVGARLQLMWIRDQVSALPTENLWHQLAKSRLRDDVHGQQYEITLDVVQSFEHAEPQQIVSDWIEAENTGYRRLTGLVEELKAAQSNDFATLSVAISEVHSLRRQAGGDGESKSS